MNNSTPADLGPRDPFAMLLDLDRVVRDMEHSERLQRLQRRVCHPLDLPTRGKQAVSDFDRLIDEAPEEPEAPEAPEVLSAQTEQDLP
jgi:hypothetical protein